jgi:hypothetical protein
MPGAGQRKREYDQYKKNGYEGIGNDFELVRFMEENHHRQAKHGGRHVR